jgi:hypothetical protein
MIDLHHDNRDMPSLCVTCADQHCRDERDTPLGGVTVVTLVDIVSMPLFLRRGEVAGVGYAFALCKAASQFEKTQAPSNVIGVDVDLRQALSTQAPCCIVCQYWPDFLFITSVKVCKKPPPDPFVCHDTPEDLCAMIHVFSNSVMAISPSPKMSLLALVSIETSVRFPELLTHLALMFSAEAIAGLKIFNTEKNPSKNPQFFIRHLIHNSIDQGVT